MSGFILEYETKAGGLVVMEGDSMKYWAGTGLPTYEGGSEGFEELYPEVVEEMVARKIIKRVS